MLTTRMNCGLCAACRGQGERRLAALAVAAGGAPTAFVKEIGLR
jgi:hypothetical protein